MGPTRSGKTTYLVRQFCSWVEAQLSTSNLPASDMSLLGSIDQTLLTHQASAPNQALPGVLALAAVSDNRIELVDRLTAATQGKYPFRATTPLGFFEDEVMLFWPLLIQQLDLKAQFPLRLAPENEQELATQLWRSELDQALIQQSAVTESRLVRRILDILQLAALAGIPLEDVAVILKQGLSDPERELPVPTAIVGDLLQRWRSWCLERGFLTYGLIAGLYWEYLLPNPTYRRHLAQRYRLLLADDVDEYPAIARHLLEALLDAGTAAAFTYNPDGAVRLGLGADPNYLGELVYRCRVETLSDRPISCLGNELDTEIVQLVTDPLVFFSLPEAIQSIQTTSRAQLLRRTADLIVEAVQTQQIAPREIAVIAPGMDAIARYSLTEILTKHQIPVESLNDQRPLVSSPIIRALLTLLTLVYPNLGRLVDRDAVAEMLVVLSQTPTQLKDEGRRMKDESNSASSLLAKRGEALPHPSSSTIDPVRAGLLADHCFAPHLDRPRLLPPTTFPRWDRLGYQSATSYQAIVQWIEAQQEQLEQRLIPNAIVLLDRAIQHFLLSGSYLPFDQLSSLRQLIETAQHYWEVHGRLRQKERFEAPGYMAVGRFIQLLRSGTVTANPFPVRPIGPASNAVTLANVFQYRSSRRSHRWQFWLDVGSTRWLSGVDALFAAPLFLQEWSGHPWTAADTMESNERRLRRILHDLLGRAGERVYLCHSDLATSGQDQTGVLLSLVNAAIPLTAL